MDQEIDGQLLSVELHRLEQEHHDYAEQLESLVHKRYLSEDEKIEEVRLKKLKLHLKDQITAKRNQHATLNLV
ncbi:MAG TPA: DUF465 domain-containing protein [Acidisarcina sp.]|nr:DUF465 domain-containing protein [Acidisarcina sp.]